MAAIDLPKTSYDDTSGQKRIITDAISLIDPSDMPMIMAMGGLDGGSGKFRFVPGKNTKIEWIEDNLSPMVGQVNGGIAATIVALVVDDGSLYKAGDVILIAAEGIHVTSVSSETLTVVRGFIGSAATIADDAAITFIGQARLEGATSDGRAFTGKTIPFNYTAIVQEQAEVTGTQEVMSQYGVSGELDYQMAKLIPDLGRKLERGLFYNTRKAGSATTPRQWGSFTTFITDNTKDWGTALAQSEINDLTKLIYADGGGPRWIAPISPTMKAVVDGFMSSALNVVRNENVAGQTVDTIHTSFGDVSFLLDRWATDTEIWLVDVMKAGMVTYRPFTREIVARTADKVIEEYIGEFSLAVMNDKAHGKLYT